MLIYIVRHGETDCNLKGLLQGWTDDPLNDKGTLLARVTGQGMRGIRFDQCISSPLLRAKQTAAIILNESNNQNVEIIYDERLKEINMGDWEQKRFRPGEREIDENDVNAFFTNPFFFRGCPNGETTQEVFSRTQEFLKDLVERDDDKNYLVVTHGFALRSMLNCLYTDKSDFWHGHVPYNCVVNIIESRRCRMQLIADDMIYYDSEDKVDQYSEY